MIHLRNAALVAALTLAGAPALAETTSKSGKLDPRVTYATYQSGQVYNVYTAVRTVTLVEVGDGERIQSIAIGDLESFRIDRLEGRKPLHHQAGGCGGQHQSYGRNQPAYLLLECDLHHKTCADVFGQFGVPGSKRSTGGAIAPALPSKPIKYAMKRKKNMPAFTPTGIGDDGYRTTFKIPPTRRSRRSTAPMNRGANTG